MGEEIYWRKMVRINERQTNEWERFNKKETTTRYRFIDIVSFLAIGSISQFVWLAKETKMAFPLGTLFALKCISFLPLDSFRLRCQPEHIFSIFYRQSKNVDGYCYYKNTGEFFEQTIANYTRACFIIWHTIMRNHLMKTLAFASWKRENCLKKGFMKRNI